MSIDTILNIENLRPVDRLIAYLLAVNPKLRIRDISNRLEISDPTAREAVKRLHARGLIRKVRDGRKFERHVVLNDEGARK